MRIVLLGPQGAGKGVQANRLSAATGAVHISTGDLVRAEIAAGTDLGRAIREYNDRGELVPDSIILDLVRPYLRHHTGWILDGFPRDLAQAQALDATLEEEGAHLDRVIALAVPDDVLVERLAGRRQSQATGKVYHLVHDPPPADDPGPFISRVDDAPEQIRRRLQLYHTKTEPLRQYYAERDLLTTVDASGDIDEVTRLVMDALTDLAAGESAASTY